MKKILSIFLIGLLVASCQNQSSRVENDLYDCLMISLSDKEIEKIKPILSGFEQHLIEKGILESSEAKSYWNLYNKMGKTGAYNFSNEFNFSEKLRFLNRENPADNQGFIDCHNQIIQSQKYLDSKLYELATEMQSFSGNRVTPVIIAKITMKHMTVEDFELDYNRFNTLMFVENFK